MLENYKNEIEEITKGFNEKQIKKLGVNALKSLSTKLNEYVNDEIEEIMIELRNLLKNAGFEEINNFKIFRKKLISLKEIVKVNYGLYERGSVSSQYVALGVVFGPAIGILLGTLVPTLLGLITLIHPSSTLYLLHLFNHHHNHIH